MSQTWSKIKKKIGEGFALPYIIGDRGGFVITTHCNGRLMIKQRFLISRSMVNVLSRRSG